MPKPRAKVGAQAADLSVLSSYRFAPALFRRFLFVLVGGETLRLFAPDRASPHIVSTVVVSHSLHSRPLALL